MLTGCKTSTQTPCVPRAGRTGGDVIFVGLILEAPLSASSREDTALKAALLKASSPLSTGSISSQSQMNFYFHR